MSKLRPRYIKHIRENAGITFPQFVLHAALAHLPELLGRGDYAKDAQEERLFTGISQKTLDACFHALQKRPPAVALQFPVSREQLPMITIVQETQPPEANIVGDDAGPVDPDIHEVTDELPLVTSAVGGETTFTIPSIGDLVSSLVELYIIRGTDSIILDRDAGDFTVDSEKKQVTIDPALQTGDALILSRYAYYGLGGGDLYAYQYRFNYVVFVETENPTLTAILCGIVWRELVLKHHELLASGLVDLEIGFRSLSLWSQVLPAIAHRTELTLTGLVDWIAFAPVLPDHIKGLHFEATDTRTGTSLLEMDTELDTWSESPEDCSEG